MRSGSLCSMTTEIEYSEPYCDDEYEYLYIILPSHLSKLVPRNYLMSHTDIEKLGIQISSEWNHYLMHRRNVLLFRKKLHIH